MVGRAIVVLDHEGLPHEFAEVMEIVGQMEYGKEKLTPTCRRRQTKSPTSKAAASASALSDPLWQPPPQAGTDTPPMPSASRLHHVRPSAARRCPGLTRSTGQPGDTLARHVVYHELYFTGLRQLMLYHGFAVEGVRVVW